MFGVAFSGCVCGGFVFTFLALRLALGLLVDAVVSLRQLLFYRWVFIRAAVSCLRFVIRVRCTVFPGKYLHGFPMGVISIRTETRILLMGRPSRRFMSRGGVRLFYMPNGLAKPKLERISTAGRDRPSYLASPSVLGKYERGTDSSKGG